MKITIDLKEFWLDGDHDLEEGLKKHLKHQVQNEIYSKIENEVRTQVTNLVKEKIEKTLTARLQTQIDELLVNGKVKSYNNSSVEVSPEEYLKERFVKDMGWSSPAEKVKELANKFGTEMKNRYDLLFASQLVAKMNETGLLKKEAAKLLLETTK